MLEKKVKETSTKMRDCRKMIDELKKEPETYAYIQSFIQEKADMFVAVRENYINIYYLGASLAKIKFNKKNQIVFELHKKYMGIDKAGYMSLSWKEHKENLDKIKENINKIAFHSDKKQNDVHVVHGKVTREKICQQWIINNNNMSDGEWYYVDMEYTMKNIPSGRFDMIAIKRKANENGQHQVAVIELKIGNGSYPGMNHKLYTSHADRYKDIKENSLYAYQTKEAYVSFGSGLVGHLCDYMRFLNAKHYNHLRQEIVYQIESLKRLGVLSETDRVAKITNTEMLSDKPEIYFVSFSHVPKIAGDKPQTIEQMKRSFYKYMYSTSNESVEGESEIIKCSEYSAENLLNTKEIEGLLQIRHQFLSMENPCFELEIGGEKYKFNCRFVDADKEKVWDCLYT